MTYNYQIRKILYSYFDYFDARFADADKQSFVSNYDSDISVWLSVDPLSDKHPNFTPYAYVYQNPMNLIDPFGLDSVNINIEHSVKTHNDRDNTGIDVVTETTNTRDIDGDIWTSTTETKNYSIEVDENGDVIVTGTSTTEVYTFNSKTGENSTSKTSKIIDINNEKNDITKNAVNRIKNFKTANNGMSPILFDVNNQNSNNEKRQQAAVHAFSFLIGAITYYCTVGTTGSAGYTAAGWALSESGGAILPKASKVKPQTRGIYFKGY